MPIQLFYYPTEIRRQNRLADVILAARSAAAAQTALLGAINGRGLLFSRAEIAEPAAMVTQNLALVALIWSTLHR